MDQLSDLLLREAGYEAYTDAGFVALLGVSIRKPPGGVEQYIKLSARRVEYARGTPEDPDVEVLPVIMFQELKSMPLSRNQEDIVDAVRRAKTRIGLSKGCVAVPIAFDAGPGEGALAVEQLRKIPSVAPSIMPLRTVSDDDRVRPLMKNMNYEMSGEALVESLAARGTSGQVLIDSGADDDTRLAFLQALREAGQTETSIGAPLTRLMAWSTEILLRPLVSPCFRMESRYDRPKSFSSRSSGVMRIL